VTDSGDARGAVDPERTALLAADVRNDVGHADGLFARIGSDVRMCGA
jgi:hypothetical protein